MFILNFGCYIKKKHLSTHIINCNYAQYKLKVDFFCIRKII